MARSREKIMADLDVLQINYDEEMSYVNLCDLLKEAEAKADAKVKADEKPLNTDMAGVTCGARTTLDHEMRLRVIEHEMGL